MRPLVLALVLFTPAAVAAQGFPAPVDSDFVVHNFTFASGETLPEVQLHYDPSPHLEKITAPLLAINSADDFVNPPELPMIETLITRVKNGRFLLLPITGATRGHGTHSIPAIWGGALATFLQTVRR